VSDTHLDELAESARNRGLKLIRSRVRTPGKRGFGKVGLTDLTGKPVLGMDGKNPAGAPDAVEDYLRNLGAKDWGASLDIAVLPRKRKPKKPARPAPANDPESQAEPVAPPPKPERKPKLELREAKNSDAPRLVELIQELDHEINEKSLRKNLKTLKKDGQAPLVATLDKQVVGMCGVSARTVIHRPAPLGRITVLVVAKTAQRHGIGRRLVEAAENWMRKQGCKLVEVTSNDRRAPAHAFYRHLGYERTSIRFAKKL
jgi:ribosomal protein S18 acetylase RimI-like enzyme